MSSAVPLPARVLVVLQARTSSTRLPGKVLADVYGQPMLLWQIERIKRARLIDGLVIATSNDASDDSLASLLSDNGIACFRGSLDDVLDRFAQAMAPWAAEHVVRLTGDCPLTDPDVVDAVIAHHIVSRADITSNAYEPTFPDGLDVEVVRVPILMEASRRAQRAFEREHVTPFIYDPKNKYRVVHYRAPIDLSGLRWTVDEPEDLEFVRCVYEEFLPRYADFRMADILRLLASRPELSELNTRFTRNAGLARSIAEEEAARR